jgi:glycosyltransferase involved in cell wall biosynthesis
MSTTAPAAEPGPIDVSVVVPTCGRLDLLDRCLDALTRQNLAPGRYEIIVVDDNPDHNTLHLVAGWRARTVDRGARIVYLANPGPFGPAAARNRGWRAARAPIIAFTDDDTVPSPSWLKYGLDAFDDNVDVLCGRVEMPLPAAPTDYQRDASQLESAEFVTANCFCRKSVLEAVDGFDERFRLAWREDSDLHFRLLGMHANIAHSPHALVVHPVRPAPWGVSLLQLKKISFDALLYKKHPQLYRQKIGAARRWDYYAVVAALLLALLGLASRSWPLAIAAGATWLLLTALFCARRLRGTAKTASHIAEMVVTSALIPPLAVFWRVAGAIKFRVRFA